MGGGQAVALVLGIALAGRYFWQHRGRTLAARRWVYRTQRWYSARDVLVVRPLMAAVLLSTGVFGWLPPRHPVTNVLVLVALVCALVVFAYLILPLPVPAWAKPDWYRGYGQAGNQVVHVQPAREIPPQWQFAAERLSAALGALTHGDTLVVGTPGPPTPPRQGLLRRRPTLAPARYVQYLRLDEDLRCECAGATSFGGELPLTAEQDAAIRALGWRLPRDGSDAEPAINYPNYHRTLARHETREATRLGIGALEIFGLRPDELDWRS